MGVLGWWLRSRTSVRVGPGSTPGGCSRGGCSPGGAVVGGAIGGCHWGVPLGGEKHKIAIFLEEYCDFGFHGFLEAVYIYTIKTMGHPSLHCGSV